MCVSGFYSQLILGSCYTAHKRIVNIMKVYLKRNNTHVELMRFRLKYRLYSRLRLRGERAPKPLYVYSLFTRWQQLAFAHKRIVTIMKVYLKRNITHVESMRFRLKYRLYSRLRGERAPKPLYVYSLFTRWQQLATNKLITIHSPDGSTSRYAQRNECTRDEFREQDC